MNPSDIRDIRGPVDIPPAWLLPVEIAAVAALLAALAWLAWRWWRRARPGSPAPTPEEVALARIEAARALMIPGRAREFGAAVSEAVRRYVEDRFGMRARPRTTDEFLADLLRDATPALAGQREPLADFLAHCDLAKFARLPLATAEMEALAASARRFVAASRPAVGDGPAGDGTGA